MLLLAFIISNVVVSVFLEKRKLKVATVTHAVMFVILSLCLICANGGGLLSDLMIDTIGEEAFDQFREAILSGDGNVAVGPFVIIEISVLALCTVICAFSAMRVVGELVRFGKNARAYVYEKREMRRPTHPAELRVICPCIYLLNCSLLC